MKVIHNEAKAKDGMFHCTVENIVLGILVGTISVIDFPSLIPIEFHIILYINFGWTAQIVIDGLTCDGDE